MSAPSVVSASQSEYDRCISSLVLAFVSDPFIRWLFPDSKQYLHYFPQVLKYFAGGAFDNSSAYRIEDFNGIALLLPPGVSPDEEALGGVMEEGLAPESQEEAFAVLEQVGESHPPVEHWYLPAMGVVPMFQCKGYGSALLVHSLEACDRAHVAVYLESTNPANVPLYQRFGFEITGEIQSGTSPTLTTMLRAAR